VAFEWTGNRHSPGTRYRIAADSEVWFYVGDDSTGMYPDGWAEAIMDEDVLCEGLLAAVRALEVYRKALEPFLRSLSDPIFESAITGPEHLDAIEAAQRLMGLEEDC